MKLVRDARTLSGKSIGSLRAAMERFNSFEEEGRVTSVLLHLQHALEMLMKAVLCQKREKVFDKATDRSIGFVKCLNLCQTRCGMSDTEAGIFRTVNSLRDEAQHWFVVVPEDLLFLHVRAAVTAYDGFLKRALEMDLATQIPSRVLPVSTMPPGDFEFLVDREYRLIGDLLRPGVRKRDEARARIRSLLAMEALVTDDVAISQKDVNRIEKAIKAGSEFGAIFPRLNTVETGIEGQGTALRVHFSKKQGAPVRFVAGDDPEGAAAVREIDLQKKFHLSAMDLAQKLGLTHPRSLALRRHLKIDVDDSMAYEFRFKKSRFLQFSDKAVVVMKEAIDGGVDLDEVWKRNRPGRKR